MTVRNKDQQSQNGEAHGAESHGAVDHRMEPDVTRPQLSAISALTVLALASAVLVPATQVNLGLSAREVGGVIMPPGMIMTRDTPGDAMRDMAAVARGKSAIVRPLRHAAISR